MPDPINYVGFDNGELVQGRDAQDKCPHGWFWLVARDAKCCEIPCMKANERALPGWTFCDCRTHYTQGTRPRWTPIKVPCERPYTMEQLRAAMALARLDGWLSD